jgi:hypothetical protein
VVKQGYMKEPRVYYLILHVGGAIGSEWPKGKSSTFARKASRIPGIRGISPRRMIRQAKQSAMSVGVYLRYIPIKLYDSSEQWRFIFRFKRFESNADMAERFAESFIYSIELLHGPVINADHDAFSFPFPAEILGEKEFLTFKALEEIESNRPYHERTVPFPHILGSALYTVESRVEAAWRIMPIVYTDDNIHRALSFLADSQHDFYVYPGQLAEAIYDTERLAPNSRIQVSWESALQNSFKAIESIIGDPPKDDRKLDQLLRSIGLDPYGKVGYREKRSLRDEIRSMNIARDKKAAHGSTPNRRLTVGEILNYQACASSICQAKIEIKLGQPIYIQD